MYTSFNHYYRLTAVLSKRKNELTGGRGVAVVVAGGVGVFPSVIEVSKRAAISMNV